MHCATAKGEVVFRKKLSRKQFLEFMQSHPKCRVAMEACATAHYWARSLTVLGHEVRLIAPKFVKAYGDVPAGSRLLGLAGPRTTTTL